MRISAAQMAVRREIMLETAFRLFAEKNIDSVRIDDIAQETGFTTRSLLRYFKSKDDLVIAVAAWAWERFMTQNRKRRRNPNGTTAAEDFAFYLESFLALYNNHADLLRFNQMFNVFVRAKHIDAMRMEPYQEVVEAVRQRFHEMYEKRDGTLCADDEEEMFSVTLHLMLAAVTRYAVGLVYRGGVEPIQELLILRDMLLERYTVH